MLHRISVSSLEGRPCDSPPVLPFFCPERRHGNVRISRILITQQYMSELILDQVIAYENGYSCDAGGRNRVSVS